MRLFLPLILLVCVSPVASSQAKSDGTLSLDDRVFVASQVYSLLQSNSKAPDFENLYKDYLQRVLASDDRRQFDLATMEFVAKHQSGHTFFPGRVARQFAIRFLRDTTGREMGGNGQCSREP